jgi:glycerol dehydrogenase-like iron-containing ADH family enzyme
MGPVIESSGPSSHAMGAAQLISKALEDLHSLDKTVETTEQLMVGTLLSEKLQKNRKT